MRTMTEDDGEDDVEDDGEDDLAGEDDVEREREVEPDGFQSLRTMTFDQLWEAWNAKALEVQTSNEAYLRPPMAWRKHWGWDGRRSAFRRVREGYTTVCTVHSYDYDCAKNRTAWVDCEIAGVLQDPIGTKKTSGSSRRWTRASLYGRFVRQWSRVPRSAQNGRVGVGSMEEQFQWRGSTHFVSSPLPRSDPSPVLGSSRAVGLCRRAKST